MFKVKSMIWFLYNTDLRHERVKRNAEYSLSYSTLFHYTKRKSCFENFSPTNLVIRNLIFIQQLVVFDSVQKFISFKPYQKHQMKFKKQPYRGVLWKRCSKNMQQITGEHPCQSVIQINLQSNLIKIALWHGCSPVNLLHIFRKPFPQNIFERLLLKFLPSLTSSNFGPLLPAGKNSNSLEVCDFTKKKRLSIKRNDLLTRTVIDAKIIRTGRDALLIRNC